MSKINLEFDTESKELNVSINGEKIEGVESCYIYRMCEDYCSSSDEESEKHFVEICTKEDTGDETMRVYKRICAADKKIKIKSAEDKLIRDLSKIIASHRYKG